MYLQMIARQWWASQKVQPKMWIEFKTLLMKSFLPEDVEDKVLSKWHTLRLELGDTMHKYVEKFWDAHLKASIFQTMIFKDQKQQLCARLPVKLQNYISTNRPQDITQMLQSSWVTADSTA